MDFKIQARYSWIAGNQDSWPQLEYSVCQS